MLTCRAYREKRGLGGRGTEVRGRFESLKGLELRGREHIWKWLVVRSGVKSPGE